jgi:hypothetical protein
MNQYAKLEVIALDAIAFSDKVLMWYEISCNCKEIHFGLTHGGSEWGNNYDIIDQTCLMTQQAYVRK